MNRTSNESGIWDLTLTTYFSVSRPLSLFYVAMMAAIFAHWAFWIPAVVLLLDVRARLSDFIRFRKIEYSTRMAELLEKSWCKRGVAQAIWPEAVVDYHSKGYRLYHILPVGAPKVFFKLRFWEAVLGTKSPQNHKHW